MDFLVPKKNIGVFITISHKITVLSMLLYDYKLLKSYLIIFLLPSLD